jgi:predicted HTH transcriptional regulator
MSGKERDVLKPKDYIGVSNYGTLCGLADAQSDSEFIGETFFFQRLDLMERRGSGFKKILDAYAFESEKRGETITPRFESTSTDFFLVLPNLNYDKVINGVASSSEGKDAEAAIGSGGEKSKEKSREKSREKIIAALKQTPHITMSDLAALIGISAKGVEKNIKILRDQGVIRRVSSDKGGHWDVIEKDARRIP